MRNYNSILDDDETVISNIAETLPLTEGSTIDFMLSQPEKFTLINKKDSGEYQTQYVYKCIIPSRDRYPISVDSLYLVVNISRWKKFNPEHGEYEISKYDFSVHICPNQHGLVSYTGTNCIVHNLQEFKAYIKHHKLYDPVDHF